MCGSFKNAVRRDAAWGMEAVTTPQHRLPANGQIRRDQRYSVLLLLRQNADRGNLIAERLVHIVDL